MLSESETLETYSWLTNDLFQRIIRKDYPDAEVEVENFTAKGALEPGENYGSTMIRAIVQYIIDGNKLEKRFVIKAAHCKAEVREMLQQFEPYKREMVMFRDIIPKVEQLLADIGDNSKLAAKCYEINDDFNDPYIIFEDLACRSYKNVDRRIGLNVAQFKIALSKLARWHAGTIVLLEETNYKDFPGIYDYKFILSSGPPLELTLTALKAASELVKSMPKFEHLSDKFKILSSNIYLKTKELLKDNGSSFMGLVHGDAWMNNFLFQFSADGQLTDALLCDFQGPYRGPIIMDVIHALFISSGETLRDRDWDILVQHYHTERKEILQKLGYSKRIPSLTETQMEFLEKSITYVGLALIGPGWRILENNGEDATTFFGDYDDEDDGERKKIQEYCRVMSNPKLRTTLEFFIDYFDRKGYLD